MKEHFLQHIWKHKLFKQDELYLTNGEKVEVLNPGVQNTNAGPDFFNVRVKIEETIWAGNAEIHLSSSDWFRHGHDKDKAYDNVVLQLVLKNDAEVVRTDGGHIPTAVLPFDKNIYNKYQSLINSYTWIPCQQQFYNIDKTLFKLWGSKLAIERMEHKTDGIIERLKVNKYDWKETFYHFLARNFGLKINAMPFEMLARSLPLKYIAKQKSNLFQIEAMLFGQSGLLKHEKEDEYYQKLKKEYEFLSNKFNLSPIEGHLWKFLRLRPSNFPTIRIAQFASLIFHTSSLFSRMLEMNNIEEYRELFRITASEYWDEHYRFGVVAKKKKKNIGKTAIDVILINTIIPFLFVYGKYKDIENYKEKAVRLLQELPPENNRIIKQWRELGVEADNALDTQALLQLKKEYCDKKRCLDCQIGNLIIRN